MLRANTASSRLFGEFWKGFIALWTSERAKINLSRAKSRERAKPEDLPFRFVAHLGAQVASQQSPILRMGIYKLAEKSSEVKVF